MRCFYFQKLPEPLFVMAATSWIDFAPYLGVQPTQTERRMTEGGGRDRKGGCTVNQME